MTRVLTFCVAITAAAAVAAAQAPQPDQTKPSAGVSQPETQQGPVAPPGETQQRDTQRPTTPPAQSQAAAATTMYIGCLERGSTPNSFALNVVEVPSSATTQAGRTQPGAPIGTTGTVTVGQRVQLVGGTNLAAHAGHKVEIRGMIVPQGTPPGRQGQPAAETRLNVSNVRMISEMCMPVSSATRGTSGSATPGTTGTTGTTTEPAPPRENAPNAPIEQPQQRQPEQQPRPQQQN